MCVWNVTLSDMRLPHRDSGRSLGFNCHSVSLRDVTTTSYEQHSDSCWDHRGVYGGRGGVCRAHSKNA
eukprot:112320-Amorphochlora_amoeboformis.AAC.2